MDLLLLIVFLIGDSCFLIVTLLDLLYRGQIERILCSTIKESSLKSMEQVQKYEWH